MAGRCLVVVVVLAAALTGCAQPAERGTFASSTLAEPTYPHRCSDGARTEFVPTAMDIEQVGKGYPVTGLGRDATDTPRTPPTSAKTTVAWDAPGNKPGGRYGNVLLNAHTWPDGTALGNAMLAQTQVGDLITLRAGRTKLCYQVTKRVEVDANADYGPFWVDDGPPQLAMIVCSGQRLGPGNWAKRTIWFAEPFFGPGTTSRGANGGKHAVHEAS